MKNTYIIIVVLIVLAVGAWFIFGNGKKAEAPVVKTPVSEEVPVKGEAGNVASVKEFTVTGKNFSFAPALITVKKGDKIKITFNNVNGFHNFVINEYGVATKQVQAPDTEVLEFTADKIGSFEYYCAVGSHRSMGMKGTLVVTK